MVMHAREYVHQCRAVLTTTGSITGRLVVGRTGIRAKEATRGRVSTDDGQPV